MELFAKKFHEFQLKSSKKKKKKKKKRFFIDASFTTTTKNLHCWLHLVDDYLLKLICFSIWRILISWMLLILLWAIHYEPLYIINLKKIIFNFISLFAIHVKLVIIFQNITFCHLLLKSVFAIITLKATHMRKVFPGKLIITYRRKETIGSFVVESDLSQVNNIFSNTGTR